MLTSVDANRRWWGAFFLLVALGMLTWGQTLLEGYLEGLVFIVYWIACFSFTLLALWTALADIFALRLRTRQAKTQLLKETLDKIEHDRKEKRPDSPDRPAMS